MKTSVWSGFLPFVIYSIKFRFDELHSDQTHSHTHTQFSLPLGLYVGVFHFYTCSYFLRPIKTCTFTFCILTESIASDQPEFVLFLVICLCDVWHESICGGWASEFFLRLVSFGNFLAFHFLWKLVVSTTVEWADERNLPTLSDID